MKLEYKVGDATKPKTASPYWILHGCNNQNLWGSGFVLALNKTFGDKKITDSPCYSYHKWFDECLQKVDMPTLGDIQMVQVSPLGDYVANMITQKGCGPVYHNKKELGIPFRYEAFEECLQRVGVNLNWFINKYKTSPTLVSPRIGCGLALADWNKVEQIIMGTLGWYRGTWQVYDLPQK